MITLLILFPTITYAQNKPFSVMGISELTCGKYVRDITDSRQSKSVYSWWVAGFVTGSNWAKGRRTSTDSPSHEAWLLKYCQDNPLEAFMEVVTELDKELDRK